MSCELRAAAAVYVYMRQSLDSGSTERPVADRENVESERSLSMDGTWWWQNYQVSLFAVGQIFSILY